MNVSEDIMILAEEQPIRTVLRNEEWLLSGPPTDAAIKAWRDQPPLEVVHFSHQYRAEPLSLPRVLFEHDEMRVEWQTMDSRQPFLHRNCDVDEMSYQIAGDRTLMTELGVVELRPGDFVRIPRGVAHDNFGRTETHLLFYTPAPVQELVPPARSSERVFPPYPGYQPRENAVELVTQCLATMGHDVVAFPADDRDMLNQVEHEEARVRVLQADPSPGTTWVYGTEKMRVGMVTAPVGRGRRYRRILDADEVQYQVEGQRTLLTQRGIVELGPGDYIRIPLGISQASIPHEPSRHISLLSRRELRQVATASRSAEWFDHQRLAALTGEIMDVAR